MGCGFMRAVSSRDDRTDEWLQTAALRIVSASSRSRLVTTPNR